MPRLIGLSISAGSPHLPPVSTSVTAYLCWMFALTICARMTSIELVLMELRLSLVLPVSMATFRWMGRTSLPGFMALLAAPLPRSHGPARSQRQGAVHGHARHGSFAATSTDVRWM